MGKIACGDGVALAEPPPPIPRRLAGSAQQNAFWDELRDGSSHVLLKARAGTGKSTSCAEGMHRLPRHLRLTYCAFNKSIATEFQSKAPSNCRAATMHSLGFGAIRDAFGEVVINDYKTEELAEKYFPRKWEDKESRYAVSKLVGLCKANLSDGQDPDGLADLAGAYGIDLGAASDEVLLVVPEVLTESRQQTAMIDFDDMVWLPVALGLRPRTSDVLFVDEAQDLNACQQSLAFSLCPEGRLVVVGDPRQSIYAFRGADAESIPNMAAKLRATSRGLAQLPLTVTWRCPASHVRLANGIVPDLEAAPGANEGEILVLNEAAALKGLEPGNLVLCRVNAPLVSACYKLLRQGVRAIVRGRDIGKGLLTLIVKLKAKSIPNLVEKLDDHRVSETAKLSRLRHPEPAIIALNDKVECLLSLSEDCRSIEDLKAKIGSLFSDTDETGAVVFSSIHKAKGLENDSVTILRPDLLPHPMARTDAEKTQEANLAYVAATRSKHRLAFAGPIPSIFSAGV